MQRSWIPRWLERSVAGEPDPTLVRLDVAARDRAPVAGLGWRLTVEVTLPPAWCGASADELDDATRELDLRLLPIIEDALGGALVRRLLGAETFVYDAYLPEERGAEPAELRARLGSLAPFTLRRHELVADPGWASYLGWIGEGGLAERPRARTEAAAPADPQVDVRAPVAVSSAELAAELADHQAINREIVAALLEQGDDPRVAREVVHFARLPSRSSAEQAAESLATEGFQVELPASPNGAPAEWLLEASRVERLDGNAADRASELLLGVLHRHGGVYDGWDCAVAAGPKAEPARRSVARVRDPHRHVPPPRPSEVRRKERG
jgi:regulator of RNase E activity RraB